MSVVLKCSSRRDLMMVQMTDTFLRVTLVSCSRIRSLLITLSLCMTSAFCWLPLETNSQSETCIHSKQHWHGCMIEKQEVSHMFHITLCRTLNIKSQQRDISSLQRTLMTSGYQQNDLKHKRQDFLEHSATSTGKRNKKLEEMTILL